MVFDSSHDRKKLVEVKETENETTLCLASAHTLVQLDLLEEGRCFARQKRVLSSDCIVAHTNCRGNKVYLSPFVSFMICVHILQGITVYFYTPSDSVD